jgi:hypothetical protein
LLALFHMTLGSLSGIFCFHLTLLGLGFLFGGLGC